MKKLKVLIVDDSAVIRKFLTQVISTESDFEVIGTASNGRIGLLKLEQGLPDAVILDLEMPEMDGLEAIQEIRKKYRTLPVIIFSVLSERGATITLNALALGATDFITKPENMLDYETAKQTIRNDLISKIRSICMNRPTEESVQVNEVREIASINQKLNIDETRRTKCGPQAFDIICIGVSTGGPDALTQFVHQIPSGFLIPIVIVLHMPAIFTRIFAGRLQDLTNLPVREGVAGAEIQPGTLWLAPGGQHMEIEKRGERARIKIHEGPPENSCRPAVDVLFRSVARVYGARALAIIMTGMGQDGLRGCEEIRRQGGKIIAQDEKSSVVWGMPGAVVRASLADEIVPLDKMGEILSRGILHASNGNVK